jgi:N-methylhydantoinase A/oxoprolinase/acetone carboxylase beta subunit
VSVGGAAYTANGQKSDKGSRQITLTGYDESVEAHVFEREALKSGAEILGPAIVEQADTTTLIEPGWRGHVTEDGTLLLERD